MKTRSCLLFAFYTLLFLFYPGDSYYFMIFSYNRDVFNQKTKQMNIKINPMPVVKPDFLPQISAEGVYIVDLPSFTPIYEKSEHQRFYPASTAKIITALVSADIYKPDNILTIKKTYNDGQVMGLVQGEKISVENLLYGTLVYSGNDAAFALADNFGYDKFISLMNKKALSLKMENSVFKNPAGLDETGQYTTPFDLALAARELLNNKKLAKISATKEIIISDEDFQYFHKLTNVNKLLGELNGIGGLKTGYTENAGENLVTFYKKNAHQFIIVILKSEDRFFDTKNLVKYLDENVEYINYSTKYSETTAGT